MDSSISKDWYYTRPWTPWSDHHDTIRMSRRPGRPMNLTLPIQTMDYNFLGSGISLVDFCLLDLVKLIENLFPISDLCGCRYGTAGHNQSLNFSEPEIIGFILFSTSLYEEINPS